MVIDFSLEAAKTQRLLLAAKVIISVDMELRHPELVSGTHKTGQLLSAHRLGMWGAKINSA